MGDLGPLGLELFFAQVPENPILNECALKSYSIPVPVLIFFLLFLNKTDSVSTPTEFISQGRRQILGLKQYDESDNADDINNKAQCLPSAFCLSITMLSALST